MVKSVYNSFAVSGQFDAVALVEVRELSKLKDLTTEIQNIKGVERTETLVQVV
jgi:DNA-binding Lrp family transcriptional regulator